MYYCYENDTGSVLTCLKNGIAPVKQTNMRIKIHIYSVGK